MSINKNILKENIIQQMRNKSATTDDYTDENVANRHAGSGDAVEDKFYKFSEFESYKQILLQKAIISNLKLENPFFRTHSSIARDKVVVNGKECINFANYNYLGLNGDSRVSNAAKQAIDAYGTSVSASRITAGENPLHRQLEQELANVHGVEDALVFVSGHATNVTTIGYLFGPNDLILYDALSHNSIIQGVILSGANRKIFPHNDFAFIDEFLATERHKFEKVLIVIEGLYSMDGDIPNLPEFIQIKEEYKALLMVDEAHSLGVLGPKGHGIASHFGLDPKQIDICMGTLSKSLGSVGGYIAGNKALIEMLRIYAPGFLYSVGMAPATAAAALESLKVMQLEPERVLRLRENTLFFLNELKKQKINVGNSIGYAIIPVITGSSMKAIKLANFLFDHGISVQSILYPAVEEKLARIRFFVSSEHTQEEIIPAIKVLLDGIKVC